MNYPGSWPPAHPPDVHTPFLISLADAIKNLSHSNGRIEATLEHMGSRLEDGDTRFREIQAGQSEIKSEIAEVRAEVAAVKPQKHDRPSRITAIKGLLETGAPLVREAWPFLAVASAATAKALGYDLSGVLWP